MASHEEYVEALLPLQQETLARAALAGVRWERYEIKDAAWSPEWPGGRPRYHKFMRTKFAGYLPDGTAFGEFDDIYEAALVGLSIVEGDTAFELRPDNVQPADGRHARGINFARPKARFPGR